MGEYIFGYIQYHTRYTDLSRADFLKNQGNPLSSKSEVYYRKIIELARDNEIPLLIVISPYAGVTENAQAVFNTTFGIAVEYDAVFID